MPIIVICCPFFFIFCNILPGTDMAIFLTKHRLKLHSGNKNYYPIDPKKGNLHQIGEILNGALPHVLENYGKTIVIK